MSHARRRFLAAGGIGVASLLPGRASADADVREPTPLSDAQREWIATRRVARYGVFFDVPPYAYVDGGRPAGVVPDMLGVVTTLTGLAFDWRAVRSREDGIARLRRGEIDLVAMLARTDERLLQFPFTDPIAHFTLGLFTRRDFPVVESLDELRGRPVAFPQGLIPAELQRDAAGMPPTFANGGIGMRGLLDGSYDAIVMPLPIAQYWIHRGRLDGVWLQTALPYRIPYGMAASPGSALLVGIVDAALRSIHQPERQALHRKWLGPAPSRISPLVALGTTAAALVVGGAWATSRRRVRTGRPQVPRRA